MSSRARTEPLERDSANDLFWRFDMRRLTAEEIRTKDGLEPGLALKYFCLIALNLNEMVYVD